MILPNPEQFKDWKSWARALIGALSLRAEENRPTLLPRHSKTALPKATADGVLIFVPDEVGGATVAYSLGGNWHRVTDGAIVS